MQNRFVNLTQGRRLNMLGGKLSELRKGKGWTQDEVAERLDVTAQAVSKWENDISCPDIMLIPKIAAMYQVSTGVSQILG